MAVADDDIAVVDPERRISDLRQERDEADILSKFIEIGISLE